MKGNISLDGLNLFFVVIMPKSSSRNRKGKKGAQRSGKKGAQRSGKKSREEGVSERVLSNLGGLLPGDPESGTQVPSRPGTLGTSGHLRSSQGGWETQGGHDNERRKAVPCRAVRILKRNGGRVEEGAHGPPRNPPLRLPRPARPGTSPPQPLARFGGVRKRNLRRCLPACRASSALGH